MTAICFGCETKTIGRGVHRAPARRAAVPNLCR
nr:MAG TPA: hypothetical protein [Caudoviricetes sp.]